MIQSISALLVIFLSLLANSYAKHLNVLTILLLNSYFLGFIDRNNFGILNKFDINAISLFLYIYYIIFNLSIKRLRNSSITLVFILLAMFYLYGILLPLYNHHSALFWSIKEGKEFIHYLCFFAIFLSVRTQQGIDVSWKYIKYISIYYVLVEIAFILGIDKLNILYYSSRYDNGLGITKVYQPMFSIVFLALFIYFWEYILRISKSIHTIIFLIIGCLITAFRSYIIGSIIALPLSVILIRKGKDIGKIGIIYALGIIFAVLIMSFSFTDSVSDRFMKQIDNYIISGVTEVLSEEKKGSSLKGREAANRFRWKYYYKKPFSGYGFIDEKSTLGKKIFAEHERELTMIDTGYLDVLIKFGIIGAIIFYSSFIFLAYKIANYAKSSTKNQFIIRCAAVFCFIITLLISQVTHGGLTYQFGIIPVSIALALLESEYIIQKKKIRRRSIN